MGITQKQNPSSSRLNHLRSHVIGSAVIVAESTIHMIALNVTVNHKYRNRLRRIPYVIRLPVVSALAGIRRSHQNQRVDPLI